jgi:hypothetical protein
VRLKDDTRSDAIHRLNAEPGIGPPVGHGLILAVASVATASALLAVYALPVKPDERVYGRVENVRDRSRVRVETGGAHGVVALGFSDVCFVGDRITLNRRTTVLRASYRVDWAGARCTRVR